MNVLETNELIGRLGDRGAQYLKTRDNRYTKEPRFFTRVEAADYLSISAKTLDKYVRALDINPKRFEDAAWLISIEEIYRVRESLPEDLKTVEKFIRGTNQKLQVIAVQNQKGGTGKTTLTTTLASGLATEYAEEYRVGIIDLDPQRTATSYYPPTKIDSNGFIVQDFDYFSSGDLMKRDYELEKGESLKSFISECFLPTTIPNLRILPASQSDRGVESVFHSLLADGKLENPYTILDEIIQSVEDEFDIIIIDTPPSMTFATINAYQSATSIIFPMQVEQNDIDATCGYFEFIDQVWNICEKNGHSGYDFIKVLHTNFKAQSSASTELLNTFSEFFGENTYQTTFNHSEAIKECSKLLSTVFDISKAEYSGRTKGSFVAAKTNAYAVISQVYRDIKANWKVEE